MQINLILKIFKFISFMQINESSNLTSFFSQTIEISDSIGVDLLVITYMVALSAH